MEFSGSSAFTGNRAGVPTVFTDITAENLAWEMDLIRTGIGLVSRVFEVISESRDPQNPASGNDDFVIFVETGTRMKNLHVVINF